MPADSQSRSIPLPLPVREQAQPRTPDLDQSGEKRGSPKNCENLALQRETPAADPVGVMQGLLAFRDREAQAQRQDEHAPVNEAQTAGAAQAHSYHPPPLPGQPLTSTRARRHRRKKSIRMHRRWLQRQAVLAERQAAVEREAMLSGEAVAPTAATAGGQVSSGDVGGSSTSLPTEEAQPEQPGEAGGDGGGGSCSGMAGGISGAEGDFIGGWVAAPDPASAPVELAPQQTPQEWNWQWDWSSQAGGADASWNWNWNAAASEYCYPPQPVYHSGVHTANANQDQKHHPQQKRKEPKQEPKQHHQEPPLQPQPGNNSVAWRDLPKELSWKQKKALRSATRLLQKQEQWAKAKEAAEREKELFASGGGRPPTMTTHAFRSLDDLAAQSAAAVVAAPGRSLGSNRVATSSSMAVAQEVEEDESSAVRTSLAFANVATSCAARATPCPPAPPCATPSCPPPPPCPACVHPACPTCPACPACPQAQQSAQPSPSQMFQQQVAPIQPQVPFGAAPLPTTPLQMPGAMTGSTSVPQQSVLRALMELEPRFAKASGLPPALFYSKSFLPPGCAVGSSGANANACQFLLEKAGTTEGLPQAGGETLPVFPTCAVVGSSGVLLDRAQGPAIDAHAAVLRFNGAAAGHTSPGFAQDVGKKTTIAWFAGEALGTCTKGHAQIPLGRFEGDSDRRMKAVRGCRYYGGFADKGEGQSAAELNLEPTIARP